MNIYVGNLSGGITECDLQKAFEVFGRVTSVKIIKEDKNEVYGCYGIMEMQDTSEAQASIEGLNEKELKGRKLKVNEIHPSPDAGRRGGGKAGLDRCGHF